MPIFKTNTFIISLFWLFFIVLFRADHSEADIFLYKKNGSLVITDSYRGSNFAKRYKFKKSKPKSASKKSNTTSKDFASEISEASMKYDVNPNLIKAVIEAESNYRPEAVSPKGAMGLMQLMPMVAKSLNVNDPFDPSQNIDGGTRHLKDLLGQFRDDKRLALAAYNAGEKAVAKYGNVPPYKETTEYVSKVLKFFNSFEKENKFIKKRTLIYKNRLPNGAVIYSDALQTKFTQ